MGASITRADVVEVDDTCRIGVKSSEASPQGWVRERTCSNHNDWSNYRPSYILERASPKNLATFHLCSSYYRLPLAAPFLCILSAFCTLHTDTEQSRWAPAVVSNLPSPIRKVPTAY